MAQITRRGDLQWRARVRRKGYPNLSKTFDTKEEAKAWAGELEKEIRGGRYVSRAAAETTTLHDALGRYETEISADKKGAGREKSIIKLLKETDLALRPMATIRSSDVAALRDSLAKRLKPATVLRRLALLSHLFTVARKEWGMESLANPIELIRKPKPNNSRTRRLAALEPDHETQRGASDDELEALVRASRSAVLPAFARLAVETAMRRSEVGHLCWGNVDLKRRVAHLADTKNGTARDVPLSSKAVAELTILKEAAEKKAKEATKKRRGRKPKDETRDIALGNVRVFEVTLDAMTRAFERATARARKQYVDECRKKKRQPDSHYLVDLRLHDLRHEATSRLANVYQLHELAKVTGHKDPRMLMRYYHPKAEELAKRLS
jgi:integrase